MSGPLDAVGESFEISNDFSACQVGMCSSRLYGLQAIVFIGGTFAGRKFGQTRVLQWKCTPSRCPPTFLQRAVEVNKSFASIANQCRHNVCKQQN